MSIQASIEPTGRTEKSRAKSASPSVRFLVHRAQQIAEELWLKQKIKYGISPRQFDVLLAVAKCEPCSQTRLVQETGIDRSTLADLVRRLARRGLVDRRRSRTDSREQVVKMTAAGSEAIRDCKRVSAQVEAKLNAPLSAGETTDLVDLLSRIVVRSKE